MLKKLFLKAVGAPIRPQTHVDSKTVHHLLRCFTHTGKSTTKNTKKKRNGDSATYTFKNRLDGETFELEVTIRKAGQEYKTHLVATMVETGTLNIESLLFDNQSEPLVTRSEICRALTHIGHYYVGGVDCDRVPEPHRQNRGDFGPLHRAYSRFWA